MAGGFLDTARRREVIVIRRGAGGRPMMKVVDLRGAAFDPIHTDAVALARFDVIYVPKTPIANADTFVAQYIRDLVPVSFSYGAVGRPLRRVAVSVAIRRPRATGARRAGPRRRCRGPSPG